MADFKRRIKDLRLQAGFSQQELADKIQVTKQTISQYERGLRKPDMDNLLALCDIFNVSSDYLLGKADVTLRMLSSDEIKLLGSSAAKKDEFELIDGYRQLNHIGKKQLHKQLSMMLKDDDFIKDTPQKNQAM